MIENFLVYLTLFNLYDVELPQEVFISMFAKKNYLNRVLNFELHSKETQIKTMKLVNRLVVEFESSKFTAAGQQKLVANLSTFLSKVKKKYQTSCAKVMIKHYKALIQNFESKVHKSGARTQTSRAKIKVSKAKPKTFKRKFKVFEANNQSSEAKVQNFKYINCEMDLRKVVYPDLCILAMLEDLMKIKKLSNFSRQIRGLQHLNVLFQRLFIFF